MEIWVSGVKIWKNRNHEKPKEKFSINNNKGLYYMI